MPEDMGGLAVAEPVESTGAAESVETPVESTDAGGEVTESSNQSDSGAEKSQLTGKYDPKDKEYVSKILKEKIDAIKAIDPAFANKLRTLNHEVSGLYREFPQGLKEAVQIKQTLGEYGGVEGLKETAAAISDYQALEGMFEKGDPAFMVQLADALPQAFSQIMPAGLEKWKQADPEMYNHVQAKVMVQTLDAANFSNTLEQIWGALDGEKQKPLKDAIAALWQTIDGYRQAGAKAPERKTNPQDEALTRREQELAAREQKALLSPIANEGRQQIQTITDREMNGSYQWSATDPDIKAAVSERVRQEVVKASSKDRTFVQEFDRLRDRGDAQGLSRHVKNFQERVTPGIVQRVAKLFAVKPKGAGPQVVKKPVAAASNGKAPDQGWVRISKQPSGKEIDWSRTDEDMVMSQKAVLKDKRRVVWQ